MHRSQPGNLEAQANHTAPRFVRDLLLAFDAQLVALFCVAPLAMGGRHEVGKTIFLALVATAVLTWLLRSALYARCAWRWSGVEPFLAAGLVLLLSQLVTLPAHWLELLSPELNTSLPFWNTSQAAALTLDTLTLDTLTLDAWQTLSIAPSVTLAALTTYLAYASLFCVVVQRLDTLDDVYRLLKLMAIAGSVMAIIGLMQFFSGCSEYLWLYHHPARSAAGKVTGSFTNQNHFANFVALGLGPLVWWTYRTKLRSRRKHQMRFLLPLGLLVICVLSILLTFSRGGVLVLAAECIVCAVILGRSGLLDRRGIAAVMVCLLILGAALFVYGYEPLASRLGTLARGDSLHSASKERWDLWAADWRAAQDFLLLGSGAGTHAEVYPRYLATQYNVRFTHAENTYLQLLLETGLVGLGLLLGAILVGCSWGWRLIRSAGRPVDSALAAGLIACGLATLAHAAVDFAWYIPACMTMAIGIAAAIFRASQLVPEQQISQQRIPSQRIPSQRIPSQRNPSQRNLELAVQPEQSGYLVARPIWAVAAMCVAGIAILLAPQRIGAAWAAIHWDEYLRQASSSSNVLLQDSDQALHSVEKLIHHLSLTVENNPRHPQAWQRLAALSMRRFDLLQRDADNAMDISQIRDAVYASQFNSRDEIQTWLSRALEGNVRYLKYAAACGKRAAELGAWRGDAYLYLAEMAFLFDGSRGLRESLLMQAREVRPHDGGVMFAIGTELLQRGKTEVALKEWKLAFHQNDELRRRVIEFLGPQVHPAVIIQAFAPDVESLQQLFEAHRSRGDKTSAAFVAQRLEPALVRRAKSSSGDNAAAEWQQAAEMAWFLDRRLEALRYQKKAVELNPDQYDWRRQLADRLATVGDFEQAVAHYRWCLQRTPYDAPLQRALASAAKQRLQQPRTAERTLLRR